MNKTQVSNYIKTNNINKNEENLKDLNRKINQINSNIIHYQKLYNSIKENENSNPKNNFSEDIYILNFNNNFKKKKKFPYSHIKIIKQLNQINHHIFTEGNINDCNEPKNFRDKYNFIINSFRNSHNNLKTIDPKRIYFSKDKDKILNNIIQKEKNNNFSEKNFENNNQMEENKHEDNSLNKLSIKNNKRIKVDFEHYAINNYIYKNPVLYKLNNKSKLPLIKTLITNNIGGPKDFSELIPQKKFNKNNFYNNYIKSKLLPKLSKQQN